ncbi:hypothetical protein [Streptomyces brasiliensis]|uniref:LysR substrate-binding domain-containing protein n=1 Tax=Streptomyces brasiliensis TaxID=1954 RepID=A0A917K3B9_9ACTN|nr:hypothetical protein [Streptomyces brasiliensis]GGI95424.1 hypothetical protein GCM10010121_002380 [Streptomyces brasiliensis]
MWNAAPRPDGTRLPHGPDVHDMEEILVYVRGGQGVVLVPAPVAAVFPRDDITCVPVADVPPGRVGLTRDDARPSPLVAAFGTAAWSLMRKGS